MSQIYESRSDKEHRIRQLNTATECDRRYEVGLVRTKHHHRAEGVLVPGSSQRRLSAAAATVEALSRLGAKDVLIQHLCMYDELRLDSLSKMGPRPSSRNTRFPMVIEFAQKSTVHNCVFLPNALKFG